jgi:hypothetical protein
MKPRQTIKLVVGVALAATAGACGGTNAAPRGDGAVIRPPDAALDHGGDSAVMTSDAAVDVGTMITPELCEKKCALIAQVDCPGSPSTDDCVSICINGPSGCDAQRLAYFQCLLTQGVQALECDPTFHAVGLKVDVCAQQVEDYGNCDMGVTDAAALDAGFTAQ